MAAHFRTAFMGSSGFSTATAPVAKPASPSVGDRKSSAKPRSATGRPSRDVKAEARKAIEAA